MNDGGGVFEELFSPHGMLGRLSLSSRAGVLEGQRVVASEEPFIIYNLVALF